LFIINILQRSLLSELLRSATQLSETIKRSAHHDMLQDNRENVYRMMNTIAQQEGIEKIRIFNKEGRIMFSTDISEKGKLLDKRGEACYACHSEKKPIERLETTKRSRIYRSLNDGHRILGMITAIYNEKSCYTSNCHFHPASQKVLGVLDIGISLAMIDNRLKTTTHILEILSILVVIITFLLITVSFRSYLIYPIKRLIAITRLISSGNLDHRIEAQYSDEFGMLVSEFNIMAENLKKARKEIENLVATLEERVRKRTDELKIAQMQLFQSEKLASLGKLAASVAHELNNPLGSILIYSGILLEDLQGKGNFDENIKKIIKETTRCKDIVKGLLDFARPKEPEIKITDLHDILIKTLDMLLKNKAIFQNISVNAAEAMENKGDIIIKTSVSEDNNYVVIGITDTGCGITQENLKRIFDPFFSTKKTKGVGLGLAISYGIVLQHKGWIDVQSEVGKGSTFKIFLPIYRD